ncbi:hypothetical protein FH972_024352 [Carpinus fangiana]|uniref:Zn(2)-C6 fungal-type domain-containing protein n=1 Tax=Carpinus fangiana TaxID=176857 RepID=A0A5N6KXT6_9ROSI|nr:hypothetical protein FH972_024352 [Carpinus fangiana]
MAPAGRGENGKNPHFPIDPNIMLSVGEGHGNKRKRASMEAEHSSGSVEPDAHSNTNINGSNGNQARPSPMKRACNECRQQKLRCDVQVDPYQDCARCRRLGLECRIDANFRRVGKRSRNAEMEREIQELRKKIADKEAGHSTIDTNLSNAQLLAKDPLTALHQGAAGSLLDLRNSTSTPRGRGSSKSDVETLGTVTLKHDKVEDLFQTFFMFYHPFLPVLDPGQPWEFYRRISPLLFWTIIAVAARRYHEDTTLLTGLAGPLSSLTWQTVAQVPQNYHVVKAFCLLCTWPLPTKSTSTDPTFMFAGLMVQIALQTGLHRPSHTQDFSRIKIELREDEVGDRIRTWASCNIVSQAISTGYGQPPKSIYDWTLTSLSETPIGSAATSSSLPGDLYWRLQIERYCNKISQKFYNNRTNDIGITEAEQRNAFMSLLELEYGELQRKVALLNSPVVQLHLLAAGLHLRLSAFFDDWQAPNYKDDLMELYLATKKFLTSALELNAPASTSGPLSGGIVSPTASASSPPFPSMTGFPDSPTLPHVGSYIMQMLLAGGFTLMKLLNSFFAQHIDAEHARTLFNATIRAIRAISVANNDLPGRLAEVLAQLWRRPVLNNSRGAVDDSLVLKVRCRMSMSLLFDSVWRWREEFQFKDLHALANLERAVENPTDPEAPPQPQQQQQQKPQQPLQGQQQNAGNLSAGIGSGPGKDDGDGNFAGLIGSGTGAQNFGGATSAASQIHGGSMQTMIAGSHETLPSTAMAGTDMGAFGDLNYEVFDPLTWMLDGDMDAFPSFEGSGSFGGTGQ